MMRTTIRGTFGSGKTDRALSLAVIHLMGNSEGTVLIINNEDRPDSLMVRAYKKMRHFGIQRPNSERIRVHDSNDLGRIKDAVNEFHPTMIVCDVEPPLTSAMSSVGVRVARQRFQDDVADIAGDVELVETVSVARPSSTSK